jgi:hypothetical protein
LRRQSGRWFRSPSEFRSRIDWELVVESKRESVQVKDSVAASEGELVKESE